MDNANVNNSIAKNLQIELVKRDIPFVAKERCIMCMPHVVSICSQCMVKSASTTQYSDDQDEYDSAVDIIGDCRDVIALTCKTVRAIRASGQRIEKFMDEIRYLNEKGLVRDIRGEKLHIPELQLLRDVQMRWDSVWSMINRFITLRPVSSRTCVYHSISYKHYSGY
jgi:hypothetical protein